MNEKFDNLKTNASAAIGKAGKRISEKVGTFTAHVKDNLKKN